MITAVTLPEVYFLHIPKTSGSAFGGWLRRLYPADQSSPFFQYHELFGRPLEEIQRYRCYSGHFGPSLVDLLDRPMATVTYLRDPVERTASLIHHILRDPNVGDYTENRELIQSLKTSGSPLDAFLEAAKSLTEFRNGQSHELTRRWYLRDYLNEENVFSPDPRRFPMEAESPPGDRLLNEAKGYLDSLPAVGLSEYPEGSLRGVAAALGLPMTGSLQFERVAPERDGVWQPGYWARTLAAHHVKKLKELNEIDHELYLHALTRFQSERFKGITVSPPGSANAG